MKSLDTRGLYILDDGFRFVIWFGGSISPDIGRNLLGEDFSGEYSKVASFTHHLIVFPTLMFQYIFAIGYLLKISDGVHGGC